MTRYWSYWKQALAKRRTLLTLFLSIIFLYVALRVIDWKEVLTAFKKVNTAWLVPIAFMIVATLLVLTIRWHFIIRGIKKIRINVLFEAIMLSYFTNIVLPVNVGELVRAYYVKKKTGLGMLVTLGTIAVERLARVFGFLVIGLGLVFFVPLVPEFGALQEGVKKATLLSLIVFFGAALLVLLIKKHRVKSAAVMHKLALVFTKKHARTIAHYSERFFTGLTLGKTKTDTVMILLCSVLTRMLYALTTLLIAKSFGITLSFTTFLLIDVVVTFAHTVGGHFFGIIGTYEATLTYALALFGVPKEVGLSVALVSDAAWLLPSFLIGFFYFWKEGFTLRKLSRLKRH